MSWAWPLLDSLDSSFLVLFRSASAHRRWGLGSSLRKDLQWGKGNKNDRLTTRSREINTVKASHDATFLPFSKKGWTKMAHVGVAVRDIYIEQCGWWSVQGLTRSHLSPNSWSSSVAWFSSRPLNIDCCLLVWSYFCSCRSRTCLAIGRATFWTWHGGFA